MIARLKSDFEVEIDTIHPSLKGNNILYADLIVREKS